MHIVGRVQAGYTNPNTGIFSEVLDQKNLIVYEAADIMASLITGDYKRQISYMYFEYINSPSGSTYVPPTITRNDGREYFDNFTGVGLNGEKLDYIRVPIITTPKIFNSPPQSEEYSGNAVYFNTTSAAVGAIGGIRGESPSNRYFSSNGIDGPSNIYSVSLVSAYNPDHASEDLVFSKLNLSTPLTVLSGSNPTIYWSIRFS
jgi:hypothetical protein